MIMPRRTVSVHTALSLLLQLAAAAVASMRTPPPMPALPVGPRAPALIPQAPKPTWNWDRIPT